jgi:hypothetical protein
MDHDLGVMIDGFRALIWLQQHGEEMGDGTGWCRECAQFAAALLRGSQPREVGGLRCLTSQSMQRQVDAATEVIDRVCPF